MLRGFLRALWLAVPLFSAVSAIAASSGTQTVTLPAVLNAVRQHNPEIAAATQQRALAEAETLTARAYPNPEIEYGQGSYRPRTGAPSGDSQVLAFSQALELPAVRNARLRSAQFGVAGATAALDAVRNEIGYQARQAYFLLLRRQEEARLAEENVDLLNDILKRVERRVEVGEAPRFELVRAEAELLSARTQAAAAQLRVEEARGLLRRLAGNALPAVFELRGEPPRTGELLPLPTLQARVLSDNPGLRALSSDYDRARARLEQERALRAPQPTLRLMDSRDPETRQTTLGVALPLPLWNRREGQIAQAQAGIDLALTQIEAQRTQLLRELDAAYARVSIAQRQIDTFENGLLASAQAALRVAESAWRFGERSFLEVLDAQRTLRGVRNDYNQARFDRHAAWLDIERLSARDPFTME